MDITSYFRKKPKIDENISELIKDSHDIELSLSDSDDQVSKSTASQQTSTTTSSREHGKKKTYRRAIEPDNLETFGIANVKEKAICVVCNQELPNSSMTDSKLVRHMQTHEEVVKLSELIRKQYFMKRFEALQKSQSFH